MWNGSIGCFNYAWVYLIPLGLVCMVAFFYFYTLKGDRLYRWNKKSDSKIYLGLKVFSSIVFLSLMLVYGLFHMGLWVATYFPGVPLVSIEANVVKKHDSFRGRFMVEAVGDAGEIVYMRFSRPFVYFKEGERIKINCKDVKFVCRINKILVE